MPGLPYDRPMADPGERVASDLKSAIRAGNRERVGTLRLLLADLKNQEIRDRGEGGGGRLDDEAFAGVVRKGIKQRKEAAEQFRKGGREEAAAREEREAEILAGYLPAQAGEDEIRAAIEAFVEEQGLEGRAAIGRLMQAMIARFGARADGATINRIAREVLEC